MMQPSAKVIAHSRAGGYTGSWGPPDVATLEVVCHRFVLAEFNTHRDFSRNSASSRAIPFKKQLEKVMTDPAIPLSFPAEQRGMQGGDELPERDRIAAEQMWRVARNQAAASASALADLGVHKSVVNRLLEPFMWHTIVVTSNRWENFFKQRCSPLAQPEIRAAAEAMRAALEASEPEVLDEGWWHRPYMDEDTVMEITAEHPQDVAIEYCNSVSAMRCARVSYLTQNGVRDWREDLDGFRRLVAADPPHWSPLEHVCRPKHGDEYMMQSLGNLPGWIQLRHIVSGEWKEQW